MRKIIYHLLAAGFILTSCTLDESPRDTADKAAIFGSEAGLQTYAYSFHKMFPNEDDAHLQEVDICDYGAINNYSSFIRKNSYSEEVSGGWSWSDLRNVNYFIVNCVNPAVPEAVRNNFIGQARFFRAYFYYDMVVKFGDVPWIDKPLDVNDEALFAEKDSRELVMENVYEDLLFACDNISRTDDATGSLVTKWVAYAFASRVCLFEGTFRKYHNLNLATSADTWLQRAAEMADYMIQHSGKKIYTGKGIEGSYRALFTSDTPVTSEVLLAACSSADLAIMSNANWKWTSPTYGNRFSMIRPFINTYLQTDGTPYTTRTGWEKESFYDECQNRDSRLSQTIRTPGYKRADGTPAPPNFFGYSYTGYQPLKFCLDDAKYDDRDLNTNAIPLFRYAEVLLNYAEAKAELGSLTDADWAKTIGELRARAGITGGLTSKPVTIDSYLQSTYFPTLTDPVILEIRRERAIELSLEGFRFNDLRRWNCGKLLLMSWKGMYIPQLNVPMDLDGNGTYDVLFYDSDANLNAAKKKYNWEQIKSTCAAVSVAGGNQLVEEVEKGNPAAGYYLTWDTPNDKNRVWGNKQYLYPIPSLVMVKNPNISQNKGWEDNGTNDGN